ncbi:MAG: hypothetical protein ACFFA3_07245 [Promethearchaeota archaeon]
MFKNLFKVYEIGREIGLTKKEINRSFSSGDETHSFKNQFISSIILVILFIIIAATIYILTMPIHNSTPPTNSTYPSGIRYSTIRIKDFKKKLKYYIKVK